MTMGVDFWVQMSAYSQVVFSVWSVERYREVTARYKTGGIPEAARRTPQLELAQSKMKAQRIPINATWCIATALSFSSAGAFPLSRRSLALTRKFRSPAPPINNASPISPKCLPTVIGTNQRLPTKLSASATGTVVTRGFGHLFSIIKICFRELKALNTIQTVLFFSTFLLGIQIGRTKPFWKRFTNVLDIPSSYFGPEGKVLKGRAVRVSDGDTLRFLHVPSPFNPTHLDKSKGEKLSETALPVRICTIDTPETSKFGKPGQPFGPEAKARMKELCEDKMIRVKLLQKDQYGRAVATVDTGRWPFRRAVDEIMLKEGLAEVYQGGGAVYGRKGLAKYLEMEEEARRSKVGIWSLKNRESAAEYKKRTK